MTDIRLKSLVIENFRSLRGKVVVPLDAQVVLIHGTNGMGKTSVLSALELGLTGRIAHLASDGDSYKKYLTTLGAAEGMISLSTTASTPYVGPTEGSLQFSGANCVSQSLLDAETARFYSERCYLPQAALGRLLEIYDDQKTGSASPLTLFVKELLGIDPLDALVDGLDTAFHVSRVRRLVPEYRSLEAEKNSLVDEVARAARTIEETSASVEERRGRLNEILAAISGDSQPIHVGEATDLVGVRDQLNRIHANDRRQTELYRTKTELERLAKQWKSLPLSDASRDQAEAERRDQAAILALTAWRTGAGGELEQLINVVRKEFPDVESFDVEPEVSRSQALKRVEAMHARCGQLLAQHSQAVERMAVLNAAIRNSSRRIEEINRDLAGGAKDAKTLANALAGIVPHIDGETCPVCDRDFSDQGVGPLSVHIASKIAALTSEAGRLQALATARAEETVRLTAVRQELLINENSQLSSESLSENSLNQARMAELIARLQTFENVANEGKRLFAEAAVTRNVLASVRRRAELSVSILPEIDIFVSEIAGAPLSSFDSVELALETAIQLLDKRLASAGEDSTLRTQALTEIDRRVRDLDNMLALRRDHDTKNRRLTEVGRALKEVDVSRSKAKLVSEAANIVRSEIVKRVFSTSLNKVWRDLFVRLAPSEQFVPAFRLPTGPEGKVDAVLETLHRSGEASGPPGAMLSQGNLNTAALTLFLALHLSVPVRLPWLVLDDPVQSMDDVHISQFAALLRTLSKGMQRQVVIAIHERALFDYLTLELSPAFPGDSLLTVEITRNFAGDAVAMPRTYLYEDDRAIAA